jgi:hypothetical protein
MTVLDRTNGQLIPSKEPPVFTVHEIGGPQSQSRAGGEEKNPGRPVYTLINFKTELTRLLL